MLDYGRWQTVLKHTRQSSKPSTVAVLVAMENVCFEQRAKHGGNAFVGSYPFLATMSGVHEDTVRNVVELLEAIGVVKVKRSYDVRRKQYSENYYTLLLIGGVGGDGNFRGGVMESEQTSESVALSKEKGEASKCPPLPLWHLDASHKKDIDEALAAKREAAAKYKAEQLAAAEERKRQEESELAARKERERIEREERLERLRLAEKKQKADKEAAELAEDARRLAMRADVAACRWAIVNSSFDDWDLGSLAFDVLRQFDRTTFDVAVDKLVPDFPNVFDKIKALIRNCPREFE